LSRFSGFEVESPVIFVQLFRGQQIKVGQNFMHGALFMHDGTLEPKVMPDGFDADIVSTLCHPRKQ
jgi:hypothetical protein